MKNTYFDLINQTYYFPQAGFALTDDHLLFNGIDIMDIIAKYGSPLRIFYLPKIGAQIQKAKELFNNSIEKLSYNGKYYYCFCTKSSHFSFVLDEVLKNKVHLELSSAFDVDLVRKLHARGSISKEQFMVCNGYKPKEYTDKLIGLMKDGYKNVLPVLDNMDELDAYTTADVDVNLGIRIAAEEEPNFEFYTSRLGIRYSDIHNFYLEKIKPNPHLKLRMLHFFINKGIQDTVYYWSELSKVLGVYCELRKVNPELTMLNLGGGFPIQYSLDFNYDYEYMIEEVVRQIQHRCKDEGVPTPDLFTEFGNFTVGESGVLVFKVLGEKLQNDQERWYMINNSLMTTMPDIYGIQQKFIILPINHWFRPFQRVNIGGLSCDGSDYYNSEVSQNQINLPVFDKKESLYVGFFHTGAYQESLSGYGGTKHCLIPSPKVLLINRDEVGNLTTQVFREEQQAAEMLQILGY
ncbi:MAG: arginine decarboxylase [Chitinophagales bacterium]|nr:arginine decarboxylase [Bacteroidota bacterium]MCB9042250.1 arginine decarboxylase [Chitinophagales bacterium]